MFALQLKDSFPNFTIYLTPMAQARCTAAELEKNMAVRDRNVILVLFSFSDCTLCIMIIHKSMFPVCT